MHLVGPVGSSVSAGQTLVPMSLELFLLRAFILLVLEGIRCKLIDWRPRCLKLISCLAFRLKPAFASMTDNMLLPQNCFG
jgi:hypothetical protein